MILVLKSKNNFLDHFCRSGFEIVPTFQSDNLNK